MYEMDAVDAHRSAWSSGRRGSRPSYQHHVQVDQRETIATNARRSFQKQTQITHQMTSARHKVSGTVRGYQGISEERNSAQFDAAIYVPKHVCNMKGTR